MYIIYMYCDMYYNELKNMFYYLNISYLKYKYNIKLNMGI